MATDSNVELILKNVRLSFEHIFKAQVPKPDKDGKVGTPTFNAAFLFPKSDQRMEDQVLDAIDESKRKMWGKKEEWPKIKSDRQPLKDGDEVDYDGYKNMLYIAARNQRAPKVVHAKKDADGKFIRLDGSEGVIYSGCFVTVIVNIWCQDSRDYGKRVNCSLEVVQFYADGDAFSGGSSVDPDERLAGLENKDLEDDDPRTEGRRTDRNRERVGREERTDRNERDRERGRDRDEPERGRREEREDRSRDREDDRSSRSSRSDDDGRSERGRERDREERPSRSSSRDDRDDRDGRDDRRETSSDRDRDREERGSRRDDRDRGRDDRDRGRERDDDRGSRRRSSDRSDLV